MTMTTTLRAAVPRRHPAPAPRLRRSDACQRALHRMALHRRRQGRQVRFESRTATSPFRFALGAGHVIRGWDEGVQGMKVGGTRVLVIPAELGYGAQGRRRDPAERDADVRGRAARRGRPTGRAGSGPRPSSRGRSRYGGCAEARRRAVAAVGGYLAESGWTTISPVAGADRQVPSGASEVLTIWCGYCAPAGTKTVSPARSARCSPAMRSSSPLALEDHERPPAPGGGGGAAAHARGHDVDADAEPARRCHGRAPRAQAVVATAHKLLARLGGIEVAGSAARAAAASVWFGAGFAMACDCTSREACDCTGVRHNRSPRFDPLRERPSPSLLGIESWKPVIPRRSMLPPVPLLLLVLVGARLLLARRGLGWLPILLATVGLVWRAPASAPCVRPGPDQAAACAH